MIPIYKQPLCDCANTSAHCLGKKTDGVACMAKDKWWLKPCKEGKCPGWGHPDCCNDSPAYGDPDE